MDSVCPQVINRSSAARVEAAANVGGFGLFNVVALLVISALVFFLYKRYKTRAQVPPPTVQAAPIVRKVMAQAAAPAPEVEEEAEEEVEEVQSGEE